MANQVSNTQVIGPSGINPDFGKTLHVALRAGLWVVQAVADSLTRGTLRNNPEVQLSLFDAREVTEIQEEWDRNRALAAKAAGGQSWI